MITKAMILAHAATVGLTCTAVQVAPPVYKAVKTRVQGHHRAVVPHRKPRIAKPAPVCPPSGIVTIGAMQNYTRPLVPIDTVNGTGVEQTTKQEGYGHGPSGGSGYHFSGGGFIGGIGGSDGNAPQPPVVTPAPEPTPASALPEPGTWAMMLAGFGMVGFAARVKTRRVAPATNLGE